MFETYDEFNKTVTVEDLIHYHILNASMMKKIMGGYILFDFDGSMVCHCRYAGREYFKAIHEEGRCGEKKGCENILDLVWAKDRTMVTEELKKCGEEAVQIAFHQLHPDGRLFWVNMQIFLLSECSECENQGGRKRLFCGIVKNAEECGNDEESLQRVSEQRNLPQEIFRETERVDKEKMSFFSHISHDIRTPVNSILGFSAIAANHPDDKKRVQDCLDNIVVSGNYLLGLVDEIMDMGRMESGKEQLTETEYDLPELLQSLYGILQPQILEKQLDFVTDISRVTDKKVFVDSLKLKQMLLNLLGNAVKFTPPGGNISLCIRQKASLDERYGEYIFLVKDTGKGMSEDFLQHIFEPYTREESREGNDIEGVGLGMCIVKNIVDLMGGRIEVNSMPGRGSAFIIHLRLRLCREKTDEESNKEKTAKTGSGISLKGTRILLAEDNEMNRKIVKEVLEEKGISVESACDGQEALQMMRNSARNYYDMILMDVKMPEMDGCESTKAIRSLQREDAKDMPIIAMTASVFGEDRERALQSGMTDHLSKPLDFGKMLEVIALYLRREEGV